MTEATNVFPTPETFKIDVYRRIQIAVAVYVIKATPEGKTPEAYACELQRRLKNIWLNATLSQTNTSLTDYVDHHILAQQQYDLSSRLFSVLSECPSLQGRSNLDICSPTPAERKRLFYHTLDYKSIENAVQANAKFVQALVQLRVLVEAKSTIPLDQFINSVSKLPNAFSIFKINAAMDTNGYGLYSAVQSIESHPTVVTGERFSRVSGVASSVVLYIIRSCSADALLKKSIQAILFNLQKIVCESGLFDEIFSSEKDKYQSMGSTYCHALSTLKSILSLPISDSNATSCVKQMISSFIQKMILKVITEDEDEEIPCHVKEDHILMILQISDGTSIWIEALDFIFCYLVGIRFFKNEERELTSVIASNKAVEKSFFLLRVIRSLLVKAQEHLHLWLKQSDSNFRAAETCAKKSIAGLWRKHYSVEVTPQVIAEKTEPRLAFAKSCVAKWRQSLELSFGCVMLENPLVAFAVSECTILIPSLDSE